MEDYVELTNICTKSTSDVTISPDRGDSGGGLIQNVINIYISVLKTYFF